MKMAEQPSDAAAETPPPTMSEDPAPEKSTEDEETQPTLENDSEAVKPEVSEETEETLAVTDDGKAETIDKVEGNEEGTKGSEGDEPTVSDEVTVEASEGAAGAAETEGEKVVEMEDKPAEDHVEENNSELKTEENNTVTDMTSVANEELQKSVVETENDNKPSETDASDLQKEAENTETKDATLDDANDNGIPASEQSKGPNTVAESEVNVDKQETQKEENLSDLNKDQLRERYEMLQTKYSAAELQLDSLREQNAEFRAQVKALEDEKKLSYEADLNEKAKQRDGIRVQADYLAHELSQTQDTEKYLREKVAELLEEKAESERKVKDLQLRLKRFVKDDLAKDERVARLEADLREISQEVQQMESHLDAETLQRVKTQRRESDRAGQNGAAAGGHAKRGTSPTPQSKTCIIV